MEKTQDSGFKKSEKASAAADDTKSVAKSELGDSKSEMARKDEEAKEEYRE